MAIRRLTSEFGTDLIAEGDIATGAVTAAKLATTLDLSSKTVTLPAAAVSAHVVVFDDNKIQANIALLGFKTAANGTLVKYNLQDQIVDEYIDAAGINSGDSTNEVREGGAFSGVDPVGILTDSATTYDISAGAQDAGALQSLTIRSDIVSVIIEAWGGRGGAGENSWKKNSAGVIDNTSSISTAEEGGGYTVRMKGTFTGIDGGETIKIAVGKSASIDDSGGVAGLGCHSGGGGASWVFLDHGASSTIGQTRGVANNKQYTPLLVAGGGGGAGTRDGNSNNIDQTPWTRHSEADANIATANGATRLGTVVSPLLVGNTGKYTTGTDDGEGGSSLTGPTPDNTRASGGGGAGFLADGAVPVNGHNGYGGEESEGKHIFYDGVFTLVCVTGVPASSTTVTHAAATFYVGTTMSGSGLTGGRTITAIISNTSFTIDSPPNFPSAQYGTVTFTFDEVAAIYGLKGGINTDTGSSYGDAFGGYGGGGAGSLSGGGGGGGYSGGSSTGTWTTDGANGIGGGSLFGSTIALSYNNVITYVENTNTLADGDDVSPTTNKLDGRVIITEQYMGPDPADLILQSTDTTAKAAPTTADIVMLIEDAAGTAVVDVNVKAYVSRYETGNTKTWTQAPLVDEGTQVVGATTKRILVAHDVTLTGTSGTQMAYKIETLVQSAALNTKIHATSFGWK